MDAYMLIKAMAALNINKLLSKDYFVSIKTLDFLSGERFIIRKRHY